MPSRSFRITFRALNHRNARFRGSIYAPGYKCQHEILASTIPILSEKDNGSAVVSRSHGSRASLTSMVHASGSNTDDPALVLRRMG
jgi:hypothetical protein